MNNLKINLMTKKYRLGLLTFEKANNNMRISFLDEFSMDIPIDRFNSVISKESGNITIGDYKFSFPKKKKSEDSIHFDIFDRKTNERLYSTGLIFSPHMNGDEWHCFKGFVNNYESFATLLYSEKEDSIGINVISKNTDMKNKLTANTYTYSYKLNNEYANIHNNYIIDALNLFNKNSIPVIIQEKDKLESILDVKLYEICDQTLINFDDIISKKDLINISTKDLVSFKDKFYNGQIYSMSNTLINWYIEKYINNVVDSSLDKNLLAREELILIKSNEIFPIDLVIDGRYEKNIKILDPKYINKENEKDLINMINSNNFNFTWGTETNMILIDHLLFHIIKNNLIDAMDSMKEKLLEVRGENYRVADSLIIIKMIETAFSNLETLEKLIEIVDTQNIKDKFKEDNIHQIFKEELITKFNLVEDELSNEVKSFIKECFEIEIKDTSLELI